MPLHPRRPRRAATLVESAIVYSVTFFLLLALVVGGMGVYRYQEVAHLAREGARYASTHGGKYQQDGQPEATGVPAVAGGDDLLPVLKARAVSLAPDRLQVAVSWSAAGSVTPSNYPYYADTNPDLVPPGQVVVQNYVTVTVSYQWTPELYLVGPLTLSSTAQMPMSY
jgi:Flp pilus assembly protein TadG